MSLSDAENLAYSVFGSLISLIAVVLHVVWAFKLRTRLHALWYSAFQHAGVLSSFLTLVLGVIYLNFKILSLKARSETTPRTSADLLYSYRLLTFFQRDDPTAW